MKIKISNLSPDVTEEELKELFSKYGKVKNVKIVRPQSVLSDVYRIAFKNSDSDNDVYYDLSREYTLSENELIN
ncbi:MAG TPA: RNA-binding protein [Mariniphaga sp.]|nr:RNA-binding protein [Mariniphaga sp.]